MSIRQTIINRLKRLRIQPEDIATSSNTEQQSSSRESHTTLIQDNEDPELVILTNSDGETEAGLIGYNINQSKALIEQLRNEELYGSKVSSAHTLSSQLGDAVASLTPSVMMSMQAGKLYQVIGPPHLVNRLGKDLTLMPSKNGGFLSAIVPKNGGKIVGHAQFSPAGSVVAPLMIYQAVHVIVGTQQLNQINRRLANIERTLDRMIQRQNAKDLGEIIAASSTLNDILQEHQHTGHFNAQMRDRLSHCERDLRAHLERLKILKSHFHKKVKAARSSHKKQERGLELAILIKEEGEQFGQDIRLLLALCNAVIQLEQALMAIALEHHPDSISYRNKQLNLQIQQCREAFNDLVNFREIRSEIQSCLDSMNWWQKYISNYNRAKTLREASEIEIDIPEKMEVNAKDQSGGFLVWMDTQKGLQVRKLPSALEAQSSEPEYTAEKQLTPESLKKTIIDTFSHNLQPGKTYYFRHPESGNTIPVRIEKKVDQGHWSGQRTDIQLFESVEVKTTLDKQIENTEFKAAVRGLAFSPDGEWLLAVSDDGHLQGWRNEEDGSNYQPFYSRKAHEKEIRCLCLKDDRLYTAGEDRNIVVWDYRQGTQVHRIDTSHRSGIFALAVCGKDSLASGSWQGEISIWNAETGAARRSLSGHSDAVLALVGHPDGKRLISAGKDRKVRIWDLHNGTCIQTLEHSERIYALALSPDGQTLATGCRSDRQIRLWNLGTAQVQQTLEGPQTSIWQLAFSSDGRHLFSGTDDNRVQIWDLTSTNLRLQLEGHRNSVYALAVSPLKPLLASGSWDRSVRLWPLDLD